MAGRLTGLISSQETETKEQRKAEKEKVYTAPVESSEAPAEERLRKRKAEQTSKDTDGGEEEPSKKKKKKKRRESSE